MKEAKIHMISRPTDEKYYVPKTEIATRATRYNEFENVKHNENGPDIHESEWGGTEDCQIIARWCKRDVVILHTKTDRGTVVPYTYNEIGERTIHHMDECGWMDTQRGKNCIYLIYDGIHYNALKLNKEHMSDNGLTQNEAKQTTNDTANTSLENKDKRKREDGQPNNNNTQAAYIYTTNSTKKADTNTHTKKKVNKMKGEPRTHTACSLVSCQMEQIVHIQRRQQPDKKKQKVKM